MVSNIECRQEGQKVANETSCISLVSAIFMKDLEAIPLYFCYVGVLVKDLRKNGVPTAVISKPGLWTHGSLLLTRNPALWQGPLHTPPGTQEPPYLVQWVNDFIFIVSSIIKYMMIHLLTYLMVCHPVLHT